jgi:hypothetical protein
MLKRNQSALQVRHIDKGTWDYVFCYLENGSLAVTDNRRKALGGVDYNFFANKFSNREFRIERKGA